MYAKCMQIPYISQVPKMFPIIRVNVEIKQTVQAKKCTSSLVLQAVTGLPVPSIPVRVGMFIELRGIAVIVLTTVLNYAFLQGLFFLFWHNQEYCSVLFGIIKSTVVYCSVIII